VKIVVYTKSNCPNCVSAKTLLKSKGLEFKEICLDDEAERVAFTVVFPDARQMPQIFIDGQRVGGLAGLQAALKQVGL
jgi:glutaredoxin 3